MMLRYLVPICIAMLLLCACCADGPAPDSDISKDLFEDPPNRYRPVAWWDWLQGNVDPGVLTRDLEEMRDKGIGGAEIWDVEAIRQEIPIPSGPAFLGEASLEAIRHAVREGGRLGLEMGMMATSGWNAGGTWVEPHHASKALYWSATNVTGPGKHGQPLPFPDLPPDKEGVYSIHIERLADGMPVYHKDVAVVAFRASDQGSSIGADDIIVLTDRLGPDGVLSWDLPDGKWTILRFVCSNSGQQLICASPGSRGPFIDFLDPEATRMHMDHIIRKLQSVLGDLDSTALKYVFIDSIELAEGQPWTDNFVAAFVRMRGYDPLPYLPVLAGYTVISEEVTARFMYDLELTVSDLLIESHYEKGSEVLHEHGLEFSAEAGGPGPPIWESCPVDALKALGAVDIPRGEFWIRHRNIFLVKQIASAAHIYGKNIVDAESFTTWRRWKDGPYAYKRIADRAFCEGLNKVGLVTFAHSPPEEGKPGWTFHAGSDFNPNITWWDEARPFMDYLSRCSYLLRQGLFVADVAYYYGDEAPIFFPAYHDVPEKPVLETLGKGYDFDVVNTEVILSRMETQDGDIVLPDGMRYRLLVLPDREDIPLEVLSKIEVLVRNGATVIGPKPRRSTGLHRFHQKDTAVSALADRLWGPANDRDIISRNYGRGAVVQGKTARQVLQERGIHPDFSYSIHRGNGAIDFIHRRTSTSDIYFVRNTADEPLEATCTFRTKRTAPQIWDPSTGHVRPVFLFEESSAGISLPMQMPAGGAIFVIFGRSGEKGFVRAVQKEEGISTTGGSTSLQITDVKAGGMEIVATENGNYTLEMQNGAQHMVRIAKLPGLVSVDAGWTLTFPDGWGAPRDAVFDTLYSWHESDIDGIRYFSGTATYHNTFQLSVDGVDSTLTWTLDLGQVREIARIWLNDQPVGIVWKPPFALDITDAIRAGSNTLRIEVTNLWVNRLAGDLDLPEDQRFTRTNQPPALEPRDDDRIWEPIPSGLLGPVRVMPAKRMKIDT